MPSALNEQSKQANTATPIDRPCGRKGDREREGEREFERAANQSPIEMRKEIFSLSKRTHKILINDVFFISDQFYVFSN